MATAGVTRSGDWGVPLIGWGISLTRRRALRPNGPPPDARRHRPHEPVRAPPFRPPRRARRGERAPSSRRAARLRVRRLRDREERAGRGRLPHQPRPGGRRGEALQQVRRAVRPPGRGHEPRGGDAGRRRRGDDLPHADEADRRDQPRRSLRRGRAGRGQRLADSGPGGQRVPLRPRPVEPGGLHDRRQPRHELGRAAHAEVWRHGQPRPRCRDGPARRIGPGSRRHGRGLHGIRPARPRGRQRGGRLGSRRKSP